MTLRAFQLKKKNGASSIEYALLLTVIMIAILLSQKYLVRGIAGRFKQLGDTFGVGRQYDPKKTSSCELAPYPPPNNFWYDYACASAYVQREWARAYGACYSFCINPWTNGAVRCMTTAPSCGVGNPGCCMERCTATCRSSLQWLSMTSCPLDCN